MSAVRTSAPAGETAPGYRPGRTLPLRVEALRQWRRRRTLVMAGCWPHCRSS